MRNKIHACMAHQWDKTKKKTILRIRSGSDPGRSRYLVTLSKRSCSREQDRETNGLIAALGTRSHSAAAQTIESAADLEIGPKLYVLVDEEIERAVLEDRQQRFQTSEN
jgi:hypothetical protein